MDLYLTGSSPLLSPRPCPHWHTDRPNTCSHVTGGQVDAAASDPALKTCPLLPLSPKKILSDCERIQIGAFEVESVFRFCRRGSEEVEFLHACDGHERGLEGETVPWLRGQISDEEVQDIWVDPVLPAPSSDPDEDDFGDDLFGDDYPRGPIVPLGLLTKAGGVYTIKQAPFSIEEHTTEKTRRPFKHALFRWEVNNGCADAWPTVVFASQPSILYRLRTMEELFAWLGGGKVRVSATDFGEAITSLQTSRGRSDFCFAVTEAGSVFNWRRGLDDIGEGTETTLADALAAGADLTTTTLPQRLDVPPIAKLALSLHAGAAVTREGELYLFSLRSPQRQGGEEARILDLDGAGAFEARKAGINAAGRRFVDVAAGEGHFVALSAEGEVWSVGKGFEGQLGIGREQFELDDGEGEWGDEGVEFAGRWREVRVEGLEERKKVMAVGAGSSCSYFVVGDGEV